MSPFTADPPQLLFETDPIYDGTTPVRAWDATADGQRFLMVKPLPTSDAGVTAINVVMNWTQELRRLVISGQ